MENQLQTLSDTLENKNEHMLKVLHEIKEEIKLLKKPAVAPVGIQNESDEVIPSPTNGDLYLFEDFCGSGAYGEVYKVRKQATKKATEVATEEATEEAPEAPEQMYAMKIIRLEGSTVNKNVAREVSLLLDLQHDNIVRVEQVFISSESMNILMEYIPDNLSEKLVLCPKTLQDLSIVKKVLKQLLSALAYLHSKNVMHRDIKPENILIGSDMKCFLADFGLARVVTEHLTPQVTTLQYRAPEVLLGSLSYTPAIDLWGVGCIFAELLVSSPAFSEGFEHDVIIDIFSKLGRPTEEEWPELQILLDFQGDIPIITKREFKAAACLDDVGKNLLLFCWSIETSPLPYVPGETKVAVVDRSLRRGRKRFHLTEA